MQILSGISVIDLVNYSAQSVITDTQHHKPRTYNDDGWGHHSVLLKKTKKVSEYLFWILTFCPLQIKHVKIFSTFVSTHWSPWQTEVNIPYSRCGQDYSISTVTLRSAGEESQITTWEWKEIIGALSVSTMPGYLCVFQTSTVKIHSWKGNLFCWKYNQKVRNRASKLVVDHHFPYAGKLIVMSLNALNIPLWDVLLFILLRWIMSY